MKALSVVVAVALAACGTIQTDFSNEVPGQPAEYRAGYSDGCVAGYAAGGHAYYSFRKDAARATRDPLYASGWTDAFQLCKGRFESSVAIFRR